MKHCKMRISNNHVIYSAEIFVLAIRSLKMKQNVGLFCFAVVEQLTAELILKQYRQPFYRVMILNSGLGKKYSELF